jgi:ubiquinone/menaquinone biosynthesis C-methylase UbiE
MARIYDAEILPIWAQRFGRMMLRGLDFPAKAMVLDVACGTGYPAVEVLRRLDEQSRLVAIDSSSAMLDVARKKAGELGGKRIFFRTESAAPRLSFASDVYDVVLCNLGLTELPSPKKSIKDFARVTKPGGKVLCTVPLAGTWAEFFDIYREVLVKHDKNETLLRLDRYLDGFSKPDEIEDWFAEAGLGEIACEVEEFTLLFRSSREFFFAPVIEYGPLATWKEIAGRGQELQDIFWHIKQAIDAYFGDRAFEVTVKAGCFRGTKPILPPEEETTGERRPFEDAGDEISVHTGEVEVMEESELDSDGGLGTVDGSQGAGHHEPDQPDQPDQEEEELEVFREDASGRRPSGEPESHSE